MKVTKYLAATALSAIVTATPAYAQGANEDEASDNNVIIVTASKRETTLQETPIAVSVVGAAQIESAQVRDLLDLQTLVPSFRVSQAAASASAQFIIRGFGNGTNNVGIEPSVGVYIDGVYRSRAAAQIGDLPNLERVEILRGPQSTLFGKNASAGVISVVTQKPQFEFGGSAELSYGNFDAVVAKADITGPISDTVAFSLAGNYNKRDGFVRDLALNQDANERDRWGVRGQLLFEPNDNLSFRLIGDYDKIDEACCTGVNVVDGPVGNVVRGLGGDLISNSPFALTSSLNFLPTNEIENYGVSLQIDHDIGALSITSISAYRGVRSDTNQDSDFTSADIFGENSASFAIDTYTTELRVASNFDGAFNFLLGGSYFKENIDQSAAFLLGDDYIGYANLLSGGAFSATEATLRFLIPSTPAGTFGAAGQGRFEDYDFTNDSFSIFGQVDFAITDDLTFTVGGNFTRDTKRVVQNNVSTAVFSGIDLVQAGVLAGVPATLATDPAFNPFLGLRPFQFFPPFLNLPNAVEDGRTADSDLSYTLRLAYDVNQNISTYATYATGFKASSLNLTAGSRPFPADFIPGSDFQDPAPDPSPIRDAGLAVNNLTTGTRFAEPEEAEVYEVGIKGDWPGFSVNLAVFQQILKNFQGNIFDGSVFVLGNAERSSVAGFEIDSIISPVRNLNFTAAVSYLDAEFDSFSGGSAFLSDTVFRIVPTDLSGERPPRVPLWTVSVGGNYTHQLDNDNELIFHADYLLEGTSEIASGLSLRRTTEVLNASVTFAMGNGLSVTAWGRNLTDDTYLNLVFPSPGQAGSLSGFRNQPRTYGGSVKFKF